MAESPELNSPPPLGPPTHEDFVQKVYHRHYQPVLDYALRLARGDEDQAQEWAKDSFVEAWNSHGATLVDWTPDETTTLLRKIVSGIFLAQGGLQDDVLDADNHYKLASAATRRPEKLTHGDLLEKVFREHYQAVHAYALSAARGAVREADDWTQQCFERAWRAYGPELAAWPSARTAALLRAITRNVFVSAWRKTHREILVEEIDDENTGKRDFSDDDPTLDVALDNVTMAGFWRTAAEELSEHEYRVAFMTWAMWMDTDEIATILSKTKRQISSTRNTAKGKLRSAGVDKILGRPETATGEKGRR